MTVNRVQKLLFSEYCDFEDMVLIESPFAQTTREGTGIRQVHLGLTPSKLVLATDVLPPVEFGNCKYVPGIDPEIETFELIAIYPVECVNLSIYRRRKRQALKARFCNNRVTYFELGGFEKRGMFWNLWCERVKFLCPGDSSSSKSETSVATSTTCSTLYLLDQRYVAANGMKQLWCKFGSGNKDRSLVNEVIGNNQARLLNRWTDRNLYMGKNFIDIALENQPIVYPPTIDEFVKRKQTISRKVLRKNNTTIPYFQEKGLNFGDCVQVNRFASGVNEGCNTGLYLTVDDYVAPRRYSQIFEDNISLSSFSPSINYEQLADAAVLTWEFFNAADPSKYQVRHKRRYGIAPKPLFLYGFGPWTLSPGDKFSAQMKRAISEISLRKQPLESELRLPISKRQLAATVSYECLGSEGFNRSNSSSIINTPKKPVIYFWTPDYWYRPKSAQETYEEQQRQLKKIYAYIENSVKKQKYRRKFLRKFYSTSKEIKDTDEDSNDEPYYKKSRKRKSGFIYNMFNRVEEIEVGSSKHPHETSLQYIKRILQFDVNWSAWDFDSSVLAEQLTMIDKELFLKIPSEELSILIWQRNAKNAPNIAAVLAFSYRTSCLVASELLKDESEKTRARLLARFINVADKCYRISNFQSCRAVLSGLQSPAIYRLRRTWAYVRKKHASKYLIFEYLCRLYRDPRLPSYQKTFYIVSQNSPHLPYIGDIIVRLLNKVPKYRLQNFRRFISRQSSFSNYTKSHTSIHSVRRIGNTQNLFAKIFKAFTTTEADEKLYQVRMKKVKEKLPVHRKAVTVKGLYEYFKPLDCYEDSRLRCLQETKEFLEKCQLGAMNYNFNINDLAKSYLLKARYMEDSENFYNSQRVESPSSITNKHNK